MEAVPEAGFRRGNPLLASQDGNGRAGARAGTNTVHLFVRKEGMEKSCGF
jgi:hypothetical protein